MRKDQLSHLRYRAEIDGLRALAVLVVILFHTGVPALPGGFIGVDIFYVISGFLITRIILSGLVEQKFSFIEFYARRIKRLLPAASFMLVTTVMFGYIILTPGSYETLAKSAIFSSVFLANFWFAGHSGYFDQSAEVSPLVHMWSLAVEEQFYLVFPLLLFGLYTFGGTRSVRLGIVAVFLTSLALGITLSPVYPNFSFYLLPTRAWELAAGALLVFLPWRGGNSSASSNALFVGGVALITYGLFCISQEDPYPGWLALLPVTGTLMLIVSAHSDGSVGKYLLTLPPVVLIGRFSYSAYLWHWPIVAYFRVYVSEREFRTHEIMLLTVLSLVAGFLSWKFIEERFRYAALPPRRILSYGAAAVAVTLAAPLAVYLAQGFPSRISAYDHAITDADLMWHWQCTEEIQAFESIDRRFCVVGSKWNQAQVRGLIWGDSHSRHWAPVFHELARDRNMTLLVAPLECPPYLNREFVEEHYPRFPNFTEDCTRKHQMTVEWLNRNMDVQLVIMAAAWSGHVRQLYTAAEPLNSTTGISMEKRSSGSGGRLSALALRGTIDRIDMRGRHILLLGDIPRPNRNLNQCALSETGSLIRSACVEPYRYLDAAPVIAWHRDSDQALEAVAAETDQVSVILPTSKLCKSRTCSTYLGGELLYRDGNHIRRNLGPQTLDELRRKLGLPAFLDAYSNSLPGVTKTPRGAREQ